MDKRFWAGFLAGMFLLGSLMAIPATAGYERDESGRLGVAGAGERDYTPGAQKEQFRRDMSEKLAEWEERVHELAMVAQDKLEAGGPDAVADVTDAWATANEALRDLEEAPEPLWEDARRRLEAAMSDLESSYSELAAELPEDTRQELAEGGH